MASLFGVDPLKFAHAITSTSVGAFPVTVIKRAEGAVIAPMIGTSGKLWSCGRPGQMRCIGLTPEAAYKSWSRMQ